LNGKKPGPGAGAGTGTGTGGSLGRAAGFDSVRCVREARARTRARARLL